MSLRDLPPGVTWIGNIKGDTGTLAYATAETIPWTESPNVTMVGPEEHRGAHFEIPLPMPGPELLQVRDDALQYRNEAEVFSSTAEVLQDAAVSALLANDGSEARATAKSLFTEKRTMQGAGGVGVSSLSVELPRVPGLPYLAFPSVAVLDETIYCVFRAAVDHFTGGQIFMTTSVNGIDWSLPERITVTGSVPGAHDQRDPAITNIDGVLFLTWYEGATTKTYMSRSADSGLSWSPAYLLPFTADHAFVSAPMLKISNGDILVPGYVDGAGMPEKRSMLLRSSDGGLTWGDETVIAYEAGESFSETNLFEIGGEVVAMIRHDFDPANDWTYVSRSTDYGESWTPPQKAYVGDGNPHGIVLDDMLLVGYRSISSHIATKTSARASALRYSFDKGLSWSTEKALSLSDGANMYTAFAKLSGRLFAVYGDETQTTDSRLYVREIGVGGAFGDFGVVSDGHNPVPGIAQQGLRLQLTGDTDPIPRSTWTTIMWDNVVRRNWGGVNLTNGTFTVDETGYYMINLKVSFTNVPDASAIAILSVNNENGGVLYRNINQNSPSIIDLVGVAWMTAEDTYSIKVNHDSAVEARRVVRGGPETFKTRLEVVKLKGLTFG